MSNDDGRVAIDMELRCRKCQPCLKARASLWTRRARAELAMSQRTWFVTLTLDAQRQHLALEACRQRLYRQGFDFDALSFEERFGERHRQIGPEITRYVKRIRKVSGAGLRLIVVAEAHKSGAPHYHALIHQTHDTPILHKHVTHTWGLGFTNAKLVIDDRAAFYVCKYLAKSALARIRASLLYGVQRSNIEENNVFVPNTDLQSQRKSIF